MNDRHKITTKLGNIFVGVNNNHSIYFQSEVDNFSVNGVLYRVDGHMERTPEGWKITPSFSCVKAHSVKYRDYTHSAWNKAHTTIFNALVEWLRKSDTMLLLYKANLEYNEARKNDMRERIAEAQKALDAMTAELAAMP